jgi:hypothetical protein
MTIATSAPSCKHAVDPREDAKAFGAILRVTSETAGITQELLAERAYYDRTCPSLLEHGLRQPISVPIAHDTQFPTWRMLTM